MHERIALVLVPLAACWTGSSKDTDRKLDAIAADLAANRAQIDKLDHRLTELEHRRDEPDPLRARLDAADKKIATTPAAPAATPPPAPSRMGPDPSKTFAVPLGTAFIDGPANAKVTMIIADEYSCPYCEKVQPTLVELRKKYGNDLRIAHRQFVVHPQLATAPALAICAATRQHAAAKLDPLLWEAYRQRQFDATQSSSPCWESAAGCPIVAGFAKQAGLDVERFKFDMKGPCAAELASGMQELQRFGIVATPSFYINGRFTSGAQPIESYSAIIDEELAKATDRIKHGAKAATYYQEWVLDRGDKAATP